MKKLIPLFSTLLLFISLSLNAQTYCESFNINEGSNYITNLTLGDINNSSTNPNNFTYYSGVSTQISENSTYNGSVNYIFAGNNSHQLKIWIDYNNNGDFTDSGEEIYSFSGSQSSNINTRNFSFTVPNTGVVNGTTRLRVMLVRTGIDPCTNAYAAGEVEDYDVEIRPSPVAPTAVCQNLNIELDLSGNASITASEINNGSTDDYDATNDLSISIDKTDFTCDDLGDNTVTLTVTDLDGLSDTCTATVNISAYTGSFTAPTLETIDTYCEYTAAAPVLNYQCGSTITGTTADATSFNTDGTYTITWSFTNGVTTETSDQTIIISTPTTPTGLSSSDTTENTTNLSWTSSSSGPFKVRYKINAESSWNVIQNIASTNTTISSLDSSTLYDVQVAEDADCATYTTTVNFTTLDIDYCTSLNVNQSSTFYLSDVSIGDISFTNNSSDPTYEYLEGTSTQISQDENFTGSVTYARPTWPSTSLVIWIDYNADGDFDDSGEEVFSNLTANGTSSVTENLSITVPSSTATGKTRMRIAMSHNTPDNSCTYGNEEGNVKDFDIDIKPSLAAPQAICQDLNIQLDINGNATIAASQINNGSNDEFDATDDLILSIDQTDFDCNHIGDNTVTLTVTDTDGLSDTCTATVNVSTYRGSFTAPTLDTVNAYCSYTATAPVMNYQCGTFITATTLDTTTFNTDGTYNITWSFDNGDTVETSTQTIVISTPSTPTALTINNIAETSANISWTSAETGSFKLRYRETGTSTWTEINSISSNPYALTTLNNGTDYDIQVSVDADCATYTSTSNFSTIEVGYCDSGLNFASDANFYISNVTLGTIDNDTDSSTPTYNYFDGTSTTVEKYANLSGTITYSKLSASTTSLDIWIDYDIDGSFNEASEKVFSSVSGTGTTSITENISITIPNTATTGKTRMRISISDNTPTDACTFNGEESSIHDFDLVIDPRDTSAFEAIMITQVYHSGTDERWIEITNNSSNIITANTIILGLYKDKSGDQTGIAPDAEFTITSSIAANTTLLIRKNTSAVISHLNTPIENSSITDFDDANDIIIITANSGTEAWDNRFDVVSNINNETSYIRNDNISTYNNTYTTNEWTAFVDDTLDAYADYSPERHPHDPLLSEIENADNSANIKLGIHNFGSTTLTSSTWDNGYPDRSRITIINDDYEHTTTNLLAKELEVISPYKLTINNVALIVSDELTINSGAELRMAGTAQLIQTHTGSKQIEGTGSLLIDQNSTVDDFYRFNYFSSPVNSVAMDGFTISDVMKDGTTLTSALSTPLDITFVSTDDGSATTPISIPENWIYSYAPNASDVSNFVVKASAGFINQTDGFTFKGPGQTQNYTFVGVPKDGDLTTVTSMGTNQNYLIGNPYPSALNAKKFIEDNESVIDGTLYFWEHADIKSAGINGHAYSGYIGGYATLTKDLGLSADNVSANNTDANNGTPYIGAGTYQTPQNYIPVGQGFFVATASNSGTITFNNSQREYQTEGASTSIFFKTKKLKQLNQTTSTVKTLNNNEKSIIKLGIDYTNDEGLKLHRQLGLVLNKSLTFDYEPGHDAISYNDGTTDIYWKFSGDNNHYIIAGVPQIQNDLEVPLNLKTGNNSELTFNIDEWQNVEREVYLLDKITNTTYPLDSNTAQLNLTPNTLYQNRFAITFKETETLSKEEIINGSIKVSYNKAKNSIIITNPNKVYIQQVELYNLAGQIIQTSKLINNIKLNTNIKKSIYILKIKTNNGTISKKLLIN